MGDPHCSYKYSGVVFEPEPWHPLVRQITERVNEVCQSRFNCVLLNWYADGQQHMGWHSDDEPELGNSPQIASLSLGQQRFFDLKHKNLGTQLKLALGHGSLLLMAGQCQQYWQHRVPKMAAATAGRINLTFREIKQKTT
jgi:alkylated DNA repair dioxygenase AlkB